MTMNQAKQAQDILSLIEVDHEKVEQLFQQMESAKGAKAMNCFNQIYKELSLHARAEELVFYPAMMEYEETKTFIEEAESEHNSAKILLEQMKSLNPSDEEFGIKLKSLKEAVLHHVEEEEGEIFDAVRQCIKGERLQRMGQEFQAAKAREEADVEALLTR